MRLQAWYGAPLAVWDDATQQFHVFWASRFYDTTGTAHNSVAGLDRIRCTTTKDFVTFTAPADCIADGTPVIDQEFQYLGQPGQFTRFIKNETINQIYQENTTGGLFGSWERIPGYTTAGSLWEGTASDADNVVAGKYHVFLDNYTEYVPFESTDLQTWTASSRDDFLDGSEVRVSYASDAGGVGRNQGKVSGVMKTGIEAKHYSNSLVSCNDAETVDNGCCISKAGSFAEHRLNFGL
ncbi:uncharacterized protein EKO05_0005032 [Ascochyta rabiei]|uniref:uncharacterized protein n=1 Tax=Didymella rabiei TaxID=5454 RepID=UPI00220FCDF3|nr:uncharacterized protein EKO05_0005032 [Ascochyta rabiei]UPX14554.1 hypothetical protein EKO05_0005032 [Ascochyta rabiei]